MRRGCLVVLEPGQLFGIITEHDLVAAMVDGAEPTKGRVDQYMSPDPRTVSLDAESARDLLIEDARQAVRGRGGKRKSR